MPAPYSETLADLCNHAKYRMGCKACCADDTRLALTEAIAETEKLTHRVKGYKDSLAEDPVHSKQMKFDVKLEGVMQEHADWTQRTEGLRQVEADVKEQVKAICDASEPSTLAEMFETDAAGSQNKLEQIWAKGARSETEKKLIAFQRETPARDTPPKADDLSRITATSDSTKKSEPSAEHTIEESLERRTILAHEPMPREELDYLIYNKDSLTVPILSVEDQLALFKSDQLMGHAAILARQYVKLVKDKANASNQKQDMLAGHKLEATPIQSTSGGWPDVENLDWAGFTNWVHRCKEADRDFRKTLKLWKEERQSFTTELADRLRNWVPPADFDDRRRNDLDPRQFFRHNVTLGELDMEALEGKKDTSDVQGKQEHTPLDWIIGFPS